MQRRLFTLAATTLAALTFSTLTHAAEELRVMVHSSFALPKPLLAQFEAQSGVKLAIIKGGDAGEMLNKLILTRASPWSSRSARKPDQSVLKPVRRPSPTTMVLTAPMVWATG